MASSADTNKDIGLSGKKRRCKVDYETVIATGSDDNIIYKGTYDGITVAIKVLGIKYREKVMEQKKLYRVADTHSGIMRLYDVEEDDLHVYMIMELCNCNLEELVKFARTDSKKEPKPSMKVFRGFNLKKSHSLPSPDLVKIFRDVVTGLKHLHQLDITHGDLKLQNVLIFGDGDDNITAKISLSKMSKRTKTDGESGRHSDIFKLGCIFFNCLTDGLHKFLDPTNLDLMGDMVEAKCLLSDLLAPEQTRRPSAKRVIEHPLLWSSDKRVSFLTESAFHLKELGNEDLQIHDGDSRWYNRLPELPMDAFTRHEKFSRQWTSLVKFIADKAVNFQEQGHLFQNATGCYPEEFDSYFSDRFPKLLMTVYEFLQAHGHGTMDEKYFKYHEA